MFRRIQSYFSALRWPQHEAGHQANQGVAWIELAVDFELFFQREIPYGSSPTYPEDTPGETSPFNLSERGRRLAEATKTFQRITGVKVFPCEKKQVNVLRPLGITFPVPGLQLRPLFLVQAGLEVVLKDVFAQSCWPTSGPSVSKIYPLRLVPHYSFSCLSPGVAPVPHKVELPQSNHDSTRAVKKVEAIGDHVFVKVDKRWTCQNCPRSWVQKPQSPKLLVCFGPDGDRRAVRMATVRARDEAKQVLENERNALLNRDSEVKKHILVPSGERWLCTTCNKSVVRSEKARFSKDPCQGTTQGTGKRKRRVRQALRTDEFIEDDHAANNQQLSHSSRRQDTSGRKDKRRKTGAPSRRSGRSAPDAPD